MKLLAIETATESCSVALLVDGELITRSELAPRRHAELLLPMCDAVIAEAGIARSQLDAIAVGRGPGAFTGVRLAVSAAQGIAMGLDRPVVPVSSLAALAMEAPDNNAPILALMDARMGEVYAGCYLRDAYWLVRLFGDEVVGSAAEIVLPGDASNVVGTGWETYRSVLEPRLATAPLNCDGLRFPQAAAIARLAVPMFEAGMACDAGELRPTYLRNNVALTIDQQLLAKSVSKTSAA